MSFTDVALQVLPRADPLLDALEGVPQAEGVLRPLALDPQRGAIRAHLTLRTSPGAAPRVLEQLHDHDGMRAVDLHDAAEDRAALEIVQEVDGASAPHPMAAFLQRFGPHGFLEPCLATPSGFFMRGLLAYPPEGSGVLQGLQALQRADGWASFRLVHVREVPTPVLVRSARQVLAPSIEGLLRLATELGYYRTPGACTLTDLASHVNLTVSPVHQRLRTAEAALVAARLGQEAPRPSITTRRELRILPSADPGVFFLDAGLWIRGSAYPPAEFTAAHPGTQVVVLPLVHLDGGPARGAIVVVEAPASDRAELLSTIEGSGDPDALDVIEDGDRFGVFRWQGDASGIPWASRGGGLDDVLGAVDGPAFLRPIVIEGGDVWLRALAPASLTPEIVRERVGRVAASHGWSDYRFRSLRPLSKDPARDALGGRSRLTERQEEVLRVSHGLGYYKMPRACTLKDVARTLGVSANAIHKNLREAEERLVTAYVAELAAGPG